MVYGREAGLHGRLTGLVPGLHCFTEFSTRFYTVLLSLVHVSLNIDLRLTIIDLNIDLRLTSHTPHYLVSLRTPFQS